MGVQNIAITVHFYLPLMEIYYIPHTVHADSPLMSAFWHFVQVSVTSLCPLHTCFLQVLHTDFTFQSFDLEQNSHLFGWFERTVSLFSHPRRPN